MEQHRRPILVTTETSQPLPLLIIDKQGELGLKLVEKLKDQFLIVYVSAIPRGKINDEIIKKIVLIPYGKKIPIIPDNTYSHIFTFYETEKETLDMLPSLLKKAEQTRSKLLFITSIVQYNRELEKHLQSNYQKFEILVYGEVFSNENSSNNPLSNLIHQARTTGKIVIANMGLKKTYPIYIEDILAGIIAVGFALDRKRKLMFLFPSHPLTEISLARILQKLEPSLKIDFQTDNEKEIQPYLPQGGEYIFYDYDLEGRIKQVDLTQKEDKTEIPKKRSRRVTIKSNYSTKKIYFILLAAIFFIPFLLIFVSAAFGAALLSLSIKSLESGNLTRAKQEAQFSNGLFQSANTASNISFLLRIVAPQMNEQFQSQINTAQITTATEVDTITAIGQIKDVINGKSLNPRNDFLHAIATIKNSLITLQKIKAEKGLPKDVLRKIDSINYPLTLAENTIDALPTILGFNTTKQYLILFQNNMELRPGGGFIGSYGLLNLHNGQVNSFKVYDVYDADGKLTQPIEPPFALNRYLGASHWFLRDSNFDVDFSKNAQTAANFLELETGQKVDGVIAIDTDFLKKILEAVGSVSVPDYKETVTPNNFYLITQNHAEKNFFPGSTQKKDFLNTLYDTIFLQLTENKNVSKISVINKIGEAIKEKHVLVFFPDKAIQELLTANNLTGTLWDGRTKQDNGVIDLLGVNEANLGTNKVNYYVKRSISQKTTINSQGGISASVAINYQNISSKTSQYGGDYKNYLRFILPNGAQLQNISINNTPITIVPSVVDKSIYTQPGFVPPSGLEVEQLQEEGDTLFGFLVTVPMGETKTVTISYTVPQSISSNRSILNYSLRLIKQPGTEDDPFTFTLAYPEGFKPFQSSPQVNDIGGKVMYDGTLSQDQIVNITFTK